MCYTNGMHASGVRVCWHGCVVPIYKRMCWYGRLRTGRHTQLFAIAVPLWWSAACFVLHSAGRVQTVPTVRPAERLLAVGQFLTCNL